MKNKYKVVVYAICKNEEKFIKRWYNSMKEADEIYVLDTGSSDNSVSLLKSCGINVKEKVIKPWRFDIARNESLKLVPDDTDICVCTDIDEVFNKGWRKTLEENWDNYDRVRYNYNWLFDKDNNPVITYYLDKIHKRFGYKWIYPVHEILTCSFNEKVNTIDNIVLNHYPDNNKSRSQYLSLLKIAVKENPESDRNMHYLGREYMHNNQYDLAIKTLKKHLSLKSSTWKEERAASMRFIARCYFKKNNITSSLKWYNKAIKEAPHLRDAYVEKCFVLYDRCNYNEIIYLCNCALDIKSNKKEYINEIFSYDNTIYDLLSLCYYYKDNKDLAIYYIDKAIKMNPDDKRLLNNKVIFEEKE